jgi:hypothetical protein
MKTISRGKSGAGETRDEIRKAGFVENFLLDKMSL